MTSSFKHSTISRRSIFNAVPYVTLCYAVFESVGFCYNSTPVLCLAIYFRISARDEYNSDVYDNDM